MLSFTSCIEVTEVLSARGLTHVPKNLSENVVTLDLSVNNITVINIDDFRTLKQVKSIDLSYNQIQTLHARSFEHVCRLQELDLSYNNIVLLPHSIFSGNQNLKKLYLKKNRLQVFGDFSKAEHILDSQSLIYLDVSFCNITYISYESLKGLPNLATLITVGNPLIQKEVEIKNSLKNLRTMKTDLCNSTTIEEFSYNLQEQGGESTSTTPSPQSRDKGKDWEDIIFYVSIGMCVVIFITVVTGYCLNRICENRRANMVAIKRQNSIKALQNRPLPQPPFQDCGYEVPVTPSNESISSVTSNNLHLRRNCGYIPIPSSENDSVIKTYTATCYVSVENNHGSTHSLSGSTEYQDNLPYLSTIFIYSHSDVTEEEEEEEEEEVNNLSVPSMDGNYSVSRSPHYFGANQPSTTGIPPRPCQRLRCPQDDGYFETKKAATWAPPTSPASPTRNVTTFSIKQINSENVFISSTSIEVGQGS